MISMRSAPRFSDGDVSLRLLRRSDENAWRELRLRNVSWLRRWDATLPQPDPEVPSTFQAMVRHNRAEARAGRAFCLGVFYRADLVGQVTLGGISLGSLRSGYVGYWIDEAVAGRGIIPTAVALVAEYAFRDLRLHRLEVNLRPENAASKRVVEKLGFRIEGTRKNYLHIDGAWRDHLTYVMFAEDLPVGSNRVSDQVAIGDTGDSVRGIGGPRP